ncbi:MAG TPA: hypothetical protein VFW68_12355 [Rhodocyclaceae bacterium]|nr:hypothetical protein [Rhodocyclaceae bacterium]
MINELEKLRAREAKIKNAAERREILSAFRDHDFPAWERYHVSRLFRRHAASAAMEAEFEAQLARAAAALAEADDEERIREAARQTYFVALQIAGYSPGEAQLIADAFVSWWQFNLAGSFGL